MYYLLYFLSLNAKLWNFIVEFGFIVLILHGVFYRYFHILQNMHRASFLHWLTHPASNSLKFSFTVMVHANFASIKEAYFPQHITPSSYTLHFFPEVVRDIIQRSCHMYILRRPQKCNVKNTETQLHSPCYQSVSIFGHVCIHLSIKTVHLKRQVINTAGYPW